MGRPSMDEKKKKKPLSVTLPKGLYDLAKSTGNSSLFVQTSIEVAAQLSKLLNGLRDGTVKKADFGEDVADLLDVWAAQFEQSVPYDVPAKKPAKKKSRAA